MGWVSCFSAIYLKKKQLESGLLDCFYELSAQKPCCTLDIITREQDNKMEACTVLHNCDRGKTKRRQVRRWREREGSGMRQVET